jgi:D-amino peptidase
VAIMKVFLSTDFEGTAGIVDWNQVLGPGAEYESGRRLLRDEVNAAIDGAIDAGAGEFVVNDSHSTMKNLLAAELHGRASLLSGKHKPLYMMEGLDGSFDAALFISYHGSIGARQAILSHTYNPACIDEVRLNGTVTGEAGINALVALHHRVPVVLVSGDEITAEEARPFMPGIESVVVKRSVSRFAAQSLHPSVACERIREGARQAIERAAAIGPPAIELPARLDVALRLADMAEMATWVGGVERTGDRTIAITEADPLALFRRFVAVVALTRGLGENV